MTDRSLIQHKEQEDFDTRTIMRQAEAKARIIAAQKRDEIEKDKTAPHTKPELFAFLLRASQRI